VAPDVTPSESTAVEVARPLHAPATVETRADRSRRGAYRYRFAAIYFVLAALVGGAIGASIVLISRDTPPPTKWSSFEPDGSSVARIRQIADHVARGYRDGTHQLVFADGSRPVFNVPGQAGSSPSEIDVSTIAVLADTSKGQAEEGDYDTYDADSAVSYKLCGGGANCSIAGGTPSTARLQLLRREALELALYTFKYVNGVDSVVVFLPPPPPTADGQQQSSGALFLRKSQIEDELHVPLARTLSPQPPPIGGMSTLESGVVDRLTRANLYAFNHQPFADGSLYLILSPSTGS
jgi:hypothetical protein